MRIAAFLDHGREERRLLGLHREELCRAHWQLAQANNQQNKCDGHEDRPCLPRLSIHRLGHSVPALVSSHCVATPMLDLATRPAAQSSKLKCDSEDGPKLASTLLQQSEQANRHTADSEL